MGYITTAISMDTELWNEMEKLRQLDDSSRSYFVQSGIRLKISQVKKKNISEFIESLSPSEYDALKDEIKKRG